MTPVITIAIVLIVNELTRPGDLEAGDVIAFSSLAPHRTGPNLETGSVRKAYILQYAPDGAFTIKDGVKTKQDDPARQFKI